MVSRYRSGDHPGRFWRERSGLSAHAELHAHSDRSDTKFRTAEAECAGTHPPAPPRYHGSRWPGSGLLSLRHEAPAQERASSHPANGRMGARTRHLRAWAMVHRERDGKAEKIFALVT